MNVRRLVASVALAVPALAVALCCARDSDAQAGKKSKPAAVAAKPAPPAAVQPPAAPAPVQPPAAIAGTAQLTVVVRKLVQPVDLDVAPGDTTGRLFIIEKVGRIRILRGGQLAPDAFLDLTATVSKASEQGLLGLAFHPDYAKNGRFYINYTDRAGDTHVSELRVDPANPDRADPKSERELVVVDQPYSNHNGGHLVFGPDGWLWVGLGDGGAANDPHGNGQKDGTLLSKMFRIDVDAATPKAVVHSKGLRNPWRYEFDRKTGDLYIADVGQNLWEEIHVVSAAAAKKGGLNFGWNLMESLHCFRGEKCDAKGLELPVVEYGHGEGGGCSITGGFVYRGKALPELDGAYFYADYCTGLLRSFRWKNGAISDHWDWKKTLDPKKQLATLSAFGIDADGELYLLSLDGVVYKLERKP